MKKLDKDIRLKIGKRLRECRKYMKLNQKDFAERIEYQQNYLSRYENGESEIPDYLKYFLVKDLNVNINWLLTGEGSMFIKDDAFSQEEFVGFFDDITKLYLSDKKGFYKFMSRGGKPTEDDPDNRPEIEYKGNGENDQGDED